MPAPTTPTPASSAAPSSSASASTVEPLTPHTLLTWLITHTSTDVRSLLAGGVAGCVAKTFTAPLDRVKILFQGNNPNLHRFMTDWSGPVRAVWWIYRQDGLLACYKGHAATLARIFPYAALNYYCYERYKRMVMAYLQRHHIERISEQAVVSVVAGSMAGTTSVLFTYPLDYVHSRITYQVKIARYRGIWQTIRSTMQEGVEQAKAERVASSMSHTVADGSTTPAPAGMRPGENVRLPLPHFLYGLHKLYTGFGTTVLGIIPYAGVSFATYDSLKKFTKRYYPDSDPPVAIRLLWGACAGAAAQTSSYPLDVVRRRMQLFGLSSTLPHYRNTWDAMRVIVQKEGVRGLYVGLSINYIKVAPAHAISFFTYEWVKKTLQVDSGQRASASKR